MQRVHVEAHINAPIEKVFAVVSDHEHFIATANGTHTEILQPGRLERCGLGCLRKVTVGKRAWYIEEITKWERPHCFEYTIHEASMPIIHRGSRLTFKAVDGGTQVQWTSEFNISVPILGWMLGAAAKRLYSKAFSTLLAQAKVKLEHPH